MTRSLSHRLFGPRASWVNAGWLCVIAALALSLMGVYAIDVGSGVHPGDGLSKRALIQLGYLAVGLLAAGIITLPHPHLIRAAAWPLLALCVGLLIFLLIPWVPSWLVRPRNGCRGWIDLGPMDLQPAELAKVAFVLAAAEYLRYRSNHRTFIGLIPPAIITMIPVALITLQPDLGMALMFIPAIFAILLAAGAKLKHLAIVVVAGALAGPAMYPMLKPYQKQRIVGLIKQIQGDPATANDPELFQASTAIMLAGSGEASGFSDDKARSIVQFSRLPERHNDMIFAVIVARFGLLGGLSVIGLYGLWFGGALITAAVCKDAFGRLVIVGFVAILCAQMIVNIGMNIGIVPIVGLTLPFVSYGGSSMLTVWIMTGLVLGIAMRKPPRMSRPTFEFED